jgi:hypothetical protein
MNIAQSLYIRTSKKRFARNFKPIGIKKRVNYLISPPAAITGFLTWLPFLGELHTLGHIVMLASRTLEPILKITKPNLFEIMFYEKTLTVLTREFDHVKASLAGRTFTYLIELNSPVNLSLSFLVDAERRMTFYGTKFFPYFNILFKDDIKGFISYFPLEVEEPIRYMKLPAAELKKMRKDINKKHPLLFVNGPAPEVWEGDLIVPDRKLTPMTDIYKLLYISDAYCGADDELGRLAMIFNKPIINP